MTNNLSKLTDLIAPNLSMKLDRLLEYLNEINPTKRAEMLLKDIYKRKRNFSNWKEIDKKVKKESDSNQKEFILREKIKAIKDELGEESNSLEIDSLKQKIDSIDCPINIKERLTKEFKKYQTLPLTSPEVTITRSYIEYLLDMPWKIKTIDNNNLKKAQETLDKNHYGLDKIKQRIIEFLVVKKQTKTLGGEIICLVGPPG